MGKLFCDCKTDAEKSAFFLSGRAVETGVIAPAISNEVAMAYHRCSELKKENDALRAKIEAMEQQEPVVYQRLYRDGSGTEDITDLPDVFAHQRPLYTLPGAQAHPAPSVPSGWLRAIDEALVVAHLGVADESDTYERAREKLTNLIGWHVDVATDPAVNGGWKLVPIVSTHEMDNAGSEHCDGYLSTAQAVWDAMLAAAPEAKP